jgi:hypothetical protein
VFHCYPRPLFAVQIGTIRYLGAFLEDQTEVQTPSPDPKSSMRLQGDDVLDENLGYVWHLVGPSHAIP